MQSITPALLLLAVLTALGVPPLAQARQIGVIEPALPLNAQRVATTVPTALQASWTDYLARSQRQLQVDKAALAAERAAGGVVPPAPASGNGEKSMPLNQPPAWYGSAEALRVADNIVSFQTPAGGWGKNQPRDGAVRQKGQAYVASNRSRFLAPGDLDTPADDEWNYVGTIDNDATITEIRFLAKVANAATSEPLASSYRTSAIRGLEYLLAAQFPNGGWPQVWPLQGGYHDAFTLNDNAIIEVAELLDKAGQGRDGFGFLPPQLKERAQAASQRAIYGLLAAQLVVGGRKSLWAQQYDALTLTPTSARNYEPVALCTSESAAVLNYLMTLPAPSPAIVDAIEGGVAALRTLALEGKAWRVVNEADGKQLVSAPGAPTLWARYYGITTLQPVFGDRDKSLHDDVAGVSLERRRGYAWFGTLPQKTLDTYARWKQGRP
ncbi:MAG: pectate lyase [Pseudomonadota bacterium]